ncbi:hypothetical protein BDF14DRAFT_1795078 [Spinellus fusiger]|nr:hypothetical protein BDF14DRAFT_1795078 [Spinellus fusiger]
MLILLLVFIYMQLLGIVYSWKNSILFQFKTSKGLVSDTQTQTDSKYKDIFSPDFLTSFEENRTMDYGIGKLEG